MCSEVIVLWSYCRKTQPEWQKLSGDRNYVTISPYFVCIIWTLYTKFWPKYSERVYIEACRKLCRKLSSINTSMRRLSHKEMRGSRVQLKCGAINNSHKDFVYAQEGWKEKRERNISRDLIINSREKDLLYFIATAPFLPGGFFFISLF